MDIKKKKKIIIATSVGIAVVLLYTVSYWILSANGGYVVSESGKNRIMMAVADSFVWQPLYGTGQRFTQVDGRSSFRGDFLGYLYYPLISFDQAYIHPTIYFIGEDGEFIDPLPAPPYEDYHPTRANRFHGRFPYE